MGLIGGVTALCIVVWFYRTAESRGLPAIQWAIAGLIAYYVPNFVWYFVVVKPWVANYHFQNTTTFLIKCTAILVGAACAILVRQRFELKAAKT